MPTIFIVFGFIFKFYSDDHTPVHVHVIKDGNEAKYNVEPALVQVFNHGFKKHEISMIEIIIEENVSSTKISTLKECFILPVSAKEHPQKIQYAI